MKNWKALVTAEAQRLRGMTRHRWAQTLVGAWSLFLFGLLVCEKGQYTDVAFGQSLSLPFIAGLLGLSLVIVLLVGRLRAAAVGPMAVWGVLAVILLLTLRAPTAYSYYIYYGLCVLLFLVMTYAAQQGLLSLPRLRLRGRTTAVSVGVLLLLSAVGMALVGVLRYMTYNAPNYDFGLFVQMYHYMRETGLPFTTCERNQLLSHFAVHVSPIYYVLLPFYAVFPSPVTLAVGQGVVLAGGGIPLYLLARRYALTDKQTLCLIAAYAAYPALNCGVLYDLHENCFLAPLLLWMFYAYTFTRGWKRWLPVVLVLLVKEDAAVYVALFAVYQLVAQTGEWRRHVRLLALAILYFAGTMWLLNQFGNGAMSYRYADLQYGDSGLAGMIKTLIVNPGLFVKQALTPLGKDNNKLRYLAQLMVPLGLALLHIRRPSRWLLLTPVLLNLLSMWSYQMDLSFQYNFGVTAFFFYLCVLNLHDAPPMERRRWLGYMATASLMLYLLTFFPQIQSNAKRMRTNYDVYRRLDAAMETIPAEASVTCSTFFLPHLAQREVVYEDYYHQTPDTDYLVLDFRPGYLGASEQFEEMWRAAGYVEVQSVENLYLILRRGEP